MSKAADPADDGRQWCVTYGMADDRIGVARLDLQEPLPMEGILAPDRANA